MNYLSIYNDRQSKLRKPFIAAYERLSVSSGISMHMKALIKN